MLIIILLVVMALFVCGVVAAALGSRMKHPAALVANLLLIGAIFWLGNASAAPPGAHSGNGNPTLILAVPLSVLGIVLIGQIYAWGRPRRFRRTALTSLLLGLFAHQAAGFELQRIRYRGLFQRTVEAASADGMRDARSFAESVMSGPGTPHMNGHFLHLNTYLMFVGWAAIAAVILLLVFPASAGAAQREEN
ncbi:hypothetical protein [Saccharibacillus alkalitolerans]|uniref:Uncharacterized protein n=1 Tax=Saccharibacillus alkalitolerans TaxID=2705290 RepID=A0ABX0FDV4_9BACL|nr:hypothetical protein [Saccharibacillus alkalitolerans]NGZ76632.1 hypothetical protein [Saccharibacillus alkalitolerans]